MPRAASFQPKITYSVLNAEEQKGEDDSIGLTKILFEVLMYLVRCPHMTSAQGLLRNVGTDRDTPEDQLYNVEDSTIVVVTVPVLLETTLKRVVTDVEVGLP